ncbi:MULTISPECIES: TetR/AcrR family transcriptional regulator [unclassified Crossiella]|uniref:TetR/AcrR family transcriptional regulator n=1 Tax=unclassified Crossiella TaxID=2620835 RepID=UPI001FFE5F0C|nr:MULTISPECIES: TetR/AcrR family transcriptional regulator [unclassified Crossiella]MCK2240455.1 TetR/AcrR family transcriptional regulator [Crossiella sp. S99.2]MCK2253094.1 TetR/AcrR family transcriptional regulator [Crossiella sp. S99.1]
MSPTGRVLSTADERRETVLRTAVGAFAAKGYYGTTTTEVAKLAGISQAYIYRLFPNKEALFVAVVQRCFDQIQEALTGGAAAVEASAPEVVLSAMGEAYARLVADRDLLLLQLHAQAAAASDELVRAAVQRGYARLVEYVRDASGGTDYQVQEFFSRGALCHLVVAMGAEQVDAPWAETLSAGIRHY